MSLTGGKRKGNKSLKAWVSFVKRVQKEEKLSYKDAIHRAKVRKDKGEKWMRGGDMDEVDEMIVEQGPTGTEEEEFEEGNMMEGGRRRRTRRRRGSRRARRTMRRRRGSRRY